MAGDKDQKTEDPTDKKLRDAAKKGDVANAPEVRHATMFVGAMIVAGGMGGWTLLRLAGTCIALWGRADNYTMQGDGARDIVIGVGIAVLRALWPVLALLFALAILPWFLQGRPTLVWSRVGLKWSKLMPSSGLSRLFGRPALVEFAKTLVKFITISVIAAMLIRPHLVALDQLIGASPQAIVRTTGLLLFALVRAIGLAVVALAVVDFVYQRRAFLQRMKMSRQEVQDEYRQSDGDPKIKARIRSIRMARSRKRMMAAVPTASVVVTNPTHYAVALKYDHGVMAAPVVIAKGRDRIALRIREVAAGANVPIVESPPLARALYASAELDRPIPVEHYAAVAEVISYVMRLARQLA
ncbi:flagellar biosynthesis protein FlhB [Sphingomonas sp. RIT328]|uniref:flagellar biosynthesis protein FlhB n=1 Tax=Sphingomonas sp. RIT328 TaxID=1470591 RepID=UPI00044763B6|nr:flagellar biosynthesis protein FlhB [Sphingomonas sp. RIT328]EZP48703.1 Flagellar biosynthesis protein FlhB [Sphingomonas sp. RIT328]